MDQSGYFTQFSIWREVPLASPDPIVFVKENYADWTLEENQDRISDTVWLTRADNQGMFNAYSQESYDPDGPSGTSWRWGSTLDDSYSELEYTSWNSAVTQSGFNVNQTLIQQAAGTPVLSLYLHDTDEYYDITFLSFGGNNSGGGFSWSRQHIDTTMAEADLWDFITTVPWIGGEDDYSRVVPTLGDSTVDTTYLSTFRVTAHTEDVDFYHDSEPITGYSVDNLHPSVPMGLMAVQSGASAVSYTHLTLPTKA